jgi:hypothetical protein
MLTASKDNIKQLTLCGQKQVRYKKFLVYR